jgi:pilus assembly protein Flp/PilA
MKKLLCFFKDEEGATAVEYAIMVALIAIVIIAMVVIVGKKANNAFSAVASHPHKITGRVPLSSTMLLGSGFLPLIKFQ